MTPAPRATRILAGSLALLFYGCRAWSYLANDAAENLLWSCHVASLFVGFGLLRSQATLNAIGFFWLSVGCPLWILDLCDGGGFQATSLLTHFGGLGLSVFGIRTLGLPGDAWWKAVLALAGLQVITRAVTPARANVNLAFAVWQGWERWFPSHLAYLALLTAVGATLCWTLSQLLRRRSPAELSAKTAPDPQ